MRKSILAAGLLILGGCSMMPSCLVRIAVALTTIVFVSGCSFLPYYSQLKAVADTGIDTGIADRQEYNDKKALIIKSLSGEITRGAMLRNFTPDERCAIDTLILGSPTEECSNMGRIAAALERLANPTMVE